MLSRGAAAIAVLLAIQPVSAATPLLISPTLVELPSAERRSATIEVTNQSDASVDVQLRGYDWTQPAGEDVLNPSTTLAISPAIATIPARGKQVFRLLDLAPPPVGEKAFRIRINELPSGAKGEAVAVNLEFLVPAFRGGKGEATPDPVWSREDRALVATNAGRRRVRMTEVKAVAASGAEIALSGAAPIYLLAGARRRFAGDQASAVRVTGVADAGPFDAALPPASR